jgi:DNA-binding response OmpR family regulator
MSTPQLLMIEDDARLAQMVGEYLTQSGFGFAHALDGASGLEQLQQRSPDLVILDLMLPDTDGLEVCRRIRALPGNQAKVSVLMLTAKGDPMDRIIGLEIGADDYLPKPFEWKELVARIRALARRAGRARPAVLRRGDLELDPARRSVTRAGAELDLTPKEFGVLEALMSADGAAVSAEDLLQQVWDEHADPFTNTVRMTIMTLRRKLGDPAVLETVMGAGYRV